MKKSVIKKILNDIKFKLVSSDLSAIAESLEEKSRNSRDFIEVKTLKQVFVELAKESPDKNEPN
jgi:hypothetical protein